MGRTIVEKILSAHTEKDDFKIGDIINVRVDFAFANDITAPLAIKYFKESGAKEVFDRKKIGLIPDHFAPNKDIKSAEQCKLLREFAQEQGIENYFEVGKMGVEHALLPEKGLVLPGDVVVGADSHTDTSGALGAFAIGVGSTDLAAIMALGEVWLKVPPTIKFIYSGKLNKWVSGKDLILYTISKIGVDGANYQVIEFSGEVIKRLSMDNRFTMCNMAVEAGAKTAIIEPDQITLEYLQGRATRPYQLYKSDPEASYEKVIEFEVSKIEPQVAFPHLPENAKPISEVGYIKIDQSIIGSCTNGRIEDLRIAAEVLKGQQVHPEVRLIIIPATQDIYLQALREGLIDLFVSAGAAVSTPTCGPCLGGYMGILAKGERAISTTNRNFVGRMGHPESEVYLASPAVAAASAVAGRIVSPEEVK
ncbi:MAG: 3-isopropylmalate dehydratase large subunit [Candidatus Infernicultor aquiphilus]|uniref:3-isopropylmalate dehydratase large subunit n=1 Tax=Candidatus Infernicultor aquiphilus TaxID=1805029 RepID=A0A1J5GIS6_9BACT|nr:MAG: 3-isopropylmalate dehydratase large subunit [Candidatus Atribacteria bacterium CG2_30_33_13]PIY33949.1 MAG: 3-isopropylmalate dehydratase large subunit [Candidatus Atribacteria bacterium CG_4_10_14_3_um_filter_34_13]PJB56622.1 MAG: 3-isopropylmalate dehydratase large subunit [Candidatus Atribacteria bacterium CG_4_9_14_3_um_filter_33_16]